MPASSRNKLNARQEAFCLLLAEGRTQKDAYAAAGYSAKGNAGEVEAYKMVRNPKVAVRLAELQAENAVRSAITVDTIIRELNEARELALRIENPTAMVSASMVKAKLLGLAVDRSIVKVTNKYDHDDGSRITLRDRGNRRRGPGIQGRTAALTHVLRGNATPRTIPLARKFSSSGS